MMTTDRDKKLQILPQLEMALQEWSVFFLTLTTFQNFYGCKLPIIGQTSKENC